METNATKQDNYKSKIDFLTDLENIYHKNYYIDSYGKLQDKISHFKQNTIPANIQIINNNNYIYLIGGNNVRNITSIVYSAIVDKNGTLKNWAMEHYLPDFLYDPQVTIIKNYLYVLGGHNYKGNTNSVYKALIKENSRLGPWTTEAPLPAPLTKSCILNTGKRIYLLGGANGNTVSTNVTFSAPIYDDGSLGDWVTEILLPTALSNTNIVRIKDKVYLLGGYNGTENLTKIYTATIKSDGTLSDWSYDSLLPESLFKIKTVVTKNKIYLLSGDDDGNKSKVYVTNINSDKILSDWILCKPLPVELFNSTILTIENKVYLIGTYIDHNNDIIFIVFVADIDNEGTLGNWYIGTVLPSFLIKSQIILG